MPTYPFTASKRDYGDPRFWARVDRTPTCWAWTSFTQRGYGMFKRDGQRTLAHRYAYELLVGPVPEGLQLDHLCRNRACVNPAHLEPVTGAENLLRSPITQASVNAAKTHCHQGHAFTPENTRLSIDGKRICRTCGRQREARYRLQAVS